MKVYAVVKTVGDEGDELLGVFASVEHAEQFIRDYSRCIGGDWWCTAFGYVECELGQEINLNRDVVWVD